MRRRAVNTALVLATAGGLVGHAGRVFARARRLGTLSVAAGPVTRRNTPVAVSLPAQLGGRTLELVPPRGPALPLDVDAQGRGVFVLPALARGQRLRFVVREGGARAARGALAIVRDADGLDVRLAGARVLRYQAVGRAPSPDVPARAVRGGYLHPVSSPSGRVVTGDYHPKHRAHHGIWTAWTAAELGGKKISFWGSDTTKHDFVSFGEIFAGAVVAGFTAKHAARDLAVQPARTVLDEEWRVRLFRTHTGPAPYHLFELEWTDRLVGTEPLVLTQHRYGGLGLRGNGAWDGPSALAVLTSTGKDRAGAEGSTGRWLHMGGVLDGQKTGFAVLGHASNFRAPQPFRVHPNEPFVSVAPAKAGPFAIEPGKPYVARYRFVVADGPPDPALLERLCDDFDTPPEVSLALDDGIAQSPPAL